MKYQELIDQLRKEKQAANNGKTKKTTAHMSAVNIRPMKKSK